MPAGDDSTSTLERHVARGDFDGFLALLNADSGPPGQRDLDRALVHAVSRNRPRMVEALLERGASADAVNEHGSTPLTEAAWRGHVHLIDMLLAGGAQVDFTARPRLRPLTRAILHGHVDCVDRLLHGGADPRWPHWLDAPLLHHAAASADPRMVSLLLEAGADVHARGVKHETALMALARGCARMGTPEAQVATLRLLLDRNVGLEECDEHGDTALMKAANTTPAGLVRALLAAGANVNHRNSAGYTPLHVACRHGLEDDRRPRPRTRKQDGMVDVIEALLSAGADPNTGARGSTVLTSAVAARCTEVVERLIQHGAEVSLAANQGHTPLMAAQEMYRSTWLLIRNGADVHARDANGRTALIWAALCRRNAARSIRALIRAGCDVNAQDHDGQTALMVASRTGVAANVQMLLDRGADATIRDNRGRTASQHAANSSDVHEEGRTPRQGLEP